jgi:hypothetical protein
LALLTIETLTSKPLSKKSIENFENLRDDRYGWNLDLEKLSIIKRSQSNNLGSTVFVKKNLRHVNLKTSGDCVFRSTDSRMS